MWFIQQAIMKIPRSRDPFRITFGFEDLLKTVLLH